MITALYIRVSTEEQAKEGYSIDAQKNNLINFCKNKNWNNLHAFVDAGYSGAKPDRPQLQELLKQTLENKIERVVVWKIDRLSRKLRYLLKIFELLEKNKVPLISMTENFDLSTPAGKLFTSILGGFAEFERENIIQRVKAVAETRRVKKRLPLGNPPIGYKLKNDRYIQTDEARIVRLIFELYLKGYAQKNTRPKPLWWYGPIFCGWGEQCSEAMRVSHNKNNHQLNLSLARRACTQHNYQQWLKLLLQKGLNPRILIVDDGWAEKPGSFLPHPERWNDMREFIESCHQQGIKVLLWWNCFESEMIPFDETIRTIEGKSAVGLYGSPCADPTNPAFIQRFRKIMYKILSPDKGCLNADGLKVDINGSIPSGEGYIVYENLWGAELMKSMMRLIYESAVSVKEDALIESHTANPYFNDTLDMLRLNDIVCPEGKEIEAMRFRYEVARRASTDWLIDTDCWPIKNLRHLHKYVRLQPELGVPALYYAQSLGNTPEMFTDMEYSIIQSVWEQYLSSKTTE